MLKQSKAKKKNQLEVIKNQTFQWKKYCNGIVILWGLGVLLIPERAILQCPSSTSSLWICCVAEWVSSGISKLHSCALAFGKSISVSSYFTCGISDASFQAMKKEWFKTQHVQIERLPLSSANFLTRLFYRFPWDNNMAHQVCQTNIAGAIKRFSVHNNLAFDVLKKWMSAPFYFFFFLFLFSYY